MTDPDTRPTAPATGWVGRLPFYYGWVNVLIAAVAMSATLPGRTYGLGLIKEPLRDELGIDDLRFNLLNFWAIIIGTVVVLPVGRLIDWLGTRLVLSLVAGSLGVSVLFMATAVDETVLAITLTLVRGFGQGALSVVAIALVGKWFRRRAGLAMGVFTVLLGVGFIAPLVVVDGVVKASGWRAGWDVIGFSLLFGLVPLGLLFARSSPEACGVTPDEPAPDPREGRPAVMTVWQAVCTPAFWVWTAASTAFNLVFSALTLDVELLMTEHGLDGKAVKGIVMGVLFVSGLPANLVAGLLARRLRLGKMLSVGVAALGLALIAFPWVRSVGGAIGFGALLGVAGGVIMVVYFAVYGHTFGRTHLGGIQAVVQVLSVFASAIGPVILAFAREANNGDTTPFFVGFAVVTAVLGVLAWVVRSPVRVASEVGGA